MTVARLRQTLEAMANIYQRSGRGQDAEALRKLAHALRCADKEQVSKAIDKLTA